MIGHIKFKERGPTPRRLAKTMNRHKKSTWHDLGVEFHTAYRLERFTEEHARAARYARRSRAYVSRKRASSRLGGGLGQAAPLVYSGESKRASRVARISETSKGVKVRYPGLRKFNLRNPKGNARPSEEFHRVLGREARDLAKFYDSKLEQRINSDTNASTDTVA